VSQQSQSYVSGGEDGTELLDDELLDGELLDEGLLDEGLLDEGLLDEGLLDGELLDGELLDGELLNDDELLESCKSRKGMAPSPPLRRPARRILTLPKSHASWIPRLL
jgi:hypothetical protein